MTLALKIILTLFCVHALFKFAVGFLVPYERRIKQISSYYEKDSKVISTYDTVMLIMVAAIVVVLFVSGVQYLSFIAGLIVGMLLIQVFYHRFNQVLPPDKAPTPPAAPNQLNSFAVQAKPGLAWREILFMTVLLAWSLWMLIVRGLFG
ncbi:hypothetical protein AB0H43_22260 [Hamadaea sp. NPDC050747]|uniref:hypothetical protein n=1 Tax=Hamadaea sp. NPDC050747 TaxID=3155789 RepID=UPI0033F7F860